MNRGDIVRVKDYMVEGSNDDLYYNEKMDLYKDNTYRIINAVRHGPYALFTLGHLDEREDRELYRWSWLEKWLEPAVTRGSIEELL